ncbi:glycosyltransferase family 2 protein [Cyanobium sp. ATX 6A2]|uniref:glycosyltransferase family 2 protein n=1 Tax=Cyanobium sp. ATX 6A2 TaxID=2823700 RepID=UPI0020CF9B1B|nr:glycosyltransferase family A protein [Cyanobium sp. ATX 6A2]MCP9887004.1 glycosyltransferase family 2 protein [Cyanobium sp. ATX 6A2]
MNGPPLVSVVMPCRNAGAFIGQAIASVQAQTESRWELLIVDDHSSDASPELIAEAARADARIQPRLLPFAVGAATARNLAIERARGRYIAFLDADDRWLPAKLEQQLACFRAHPGAAIVCSSYYTVRAIDEPLQHVVQAPQRISFREIVRTNAICTSTAVVDTAVVGRCYLPRLTITHDWGLWLQIFARDPEQVVCCGVCAPLAVRVRHSRSLSANPLRTTLDSFLTLRCYSGLSTPAVLLALAHHSLAALRKRL